MKWFRRQPKQYVFRGISGGDATLHEGDSLTMNQGFTMWIREGGVFEFHPVMTDEQMLDMSARDISAKYGVTVT